MGKSFSPWSRQLATTEASTSPSRRPTMPGERRQLLQTRRSSRRPHSRILTMTSWSLDRLGEFEEMWLDCYCGTASRQDEQLMPPKRGGNCGRRHSLDFY